MADQRLVNLRGYAVEHLEPAVVLVTGTEPRGRVHGGQQVTRRNHPWRRTERVPYAAHVAVEPVEPLDVAEPVGDLLAMPEAAGIQLRVLQNLWPFWDAVVASMGGFSGGRLSNARPRPAAHA